MSLRTLAVLSLLFCVGGAACASEAGSSPHASGQGSGDAQAEADASTGGGGDGGNVQQQPVEAGPSDASTPDSRAEDPGCEAAIAAPPASLGVDVFYTKYLNAAGIPVISSAAPDDEALRVVCRLATNMLAKRNDARLEAIAHDLRIGVMGEDEVTTDMPEHADLNEVFPPTNWDERARGLGATLARPLSSCAEENVLCLAGDRYAGENIFVHEFAHSLYHLGIVYADPSFAGRLQAAYQASIGAGRWANTYAASNVDEYFAEGAQSFFQVNREAVPADGIHNEIDTRAELEAYDPALHALLAEVFEPADLPLCP